MFSRIGLPASPHLPSIPLPPHRLSAHIKDPFPPQFWDTKHVLHSVWHPMTFLGWVHQQHFLDPETKVMWGGKGGIRWIVFALVRMVLQVAETSIDKGMKNTKEYSEFVGCLELYLGACCNVVFDQVQGSIAILSKANRARQEVSEDQMTYGDPPVAYKRQPVEEVPIPPSPTKNFRFKSPLEEGSPAKSTSLDETILKGFRATAGHVSLYFPAYMANSSHATNAQLKEITNAPDLKKNPIYARLIAKSTQYLQKISSRFVVP